MSSNTNHTPIRVSVTFADSAVFAGEDVTAIITFRNVTPVATDERSNPRGHKATPSLRKPQPAPRPPSVAHSVTPSVAPSAALSYAPSAIAGSIQPQPIASRHSSSQDTVGAGGAVGPVQGPGQGSMPLGGVRRHRPALSLNTPSVAQRPASSYGRSSTATGMNNAAPMVKPVHKHGRSLSIMSVNNDIGGRGGNGAGLSPGLGMTPMNSSSKRPAKGHGRSASLQVVPGKGLGFMGGTRLTQPSPLLESAVAPTFNRSQSDLLLSSRPRQRPQPPGGRSTAPNTPARGLQRQPSGSFSQSFKFPPSPGKNPAIDVPVEEEQEPTVSPKTRMKSFRGHSPILSEGNTPVSAGDRLSPASRMLAGTSMNGTPRSSGEFYALSTNSTDTLASDYISQQQSTSRLLPSAMRPGPPERRGSALAPSAQQRNRQGPEVLMMGYAQISGTFTLDGSLVNQAPFEEVKRKGVLGSRVGGGVVGVEQNRATKRPDSGLFGSLGWSSIGESLTGLLGTSEPSSIREMRGMAKEKKVPLLSTPQSILFVDLRLQPGEERKFEYKMQLPRGLPPSFRGRAIKVAYVVTVGVQRAGSVGGKGQGVKSVEVPFKVLGSVTPNGDVLGHDLMSPYIILRDESTVTAIPPPHSQPSRNGSSPDPSSARPPSSVRKLSRSSPIKDNEAATDFLTYVNNLLFKPPASATSPNQALLSPTEPAPQLGRRRRRSTTEDIEPQPRTMKEAIALAIQHANVPSPVQPSTTAPSQSRNSYAIARSGRPIANITLSRPCFRLGETIPISIDFSSTVTPVIAVSVSLETHENVDPAIAMRSAGSIARVTRRIWQRWEGVTMWARRVGVQLQVPPTACPEFVTSGVGLGWGVRVGFVVLRDSKVGTAVGVGDDQYGVNDGAGDNDYDYENGEQGEGQRGGKAPRQKRWQDIVGSGLLEEIMKDERGTVLAAVEKVGVESFEVVVPVRVYGAVVGNDVSGAGTGEGSEGLAI